MSTDRELLEAAAQAAGIKLHHWTHGGRFVSVDPDTDDPGGFWNPLTDDGDALQLVVKREMEVRVSSYGAAVRIGGEGARWFGCEAHLHGGIEAATRRAIVLAAAALAPQPKAGEHP